MAALQKLIEDKIRGSGRRAVSEGRREVRGRDVFQQTMLQRAEDVNRGLGRAVADTATTCQ